MNEQELINEKLEQIRKLKEEVADLRGSTIASCVKEKMLIPSYPYFWNGYKESICERRATIGSAWYHIRNASMLIFEKRLRDKNQRICQKNMTQQQRRRAARFCDEVIRIFNKYILEEYGNEYPIIRVEEDNE